MTGPADDDEEFDVRGGGTDGGLGDRLLQASRRVRELDLPPADRERAARRLVAITDASKHDLGRASQRLDALLADLDAGRVSASEA